MGRRWPSSRPNDNVGTKDIDKGEGAMQGKEVGVGGTKKVSMSICIRVDYCCLLFKLGRSPDNPRHAKSLCWRVEVRGQCREVSTFRSLLGTNAKLTAQRPHPFHRKPRQLAINANMRWRIPPMPRPSTTRNASSLTSTTGEVASGLQQVAESLAQQRR